MASDQGVGTQGEKSEECQADYEQLKDVKEGIDSLAHMEPLYPVFGHNNLNSRSTNVLVLLVDMSFGEGYRLQPTKRVGGERNQKTYKL